MTKKKRQRSINICDVFKVKKKQKKSSKVMKTKSRQSLQQGCDLLDDKFVQLHQEQAYNKPHHNKAQSTTGAYHTQQRVEVNVDDATDQLAKL